MYIALILKKTSKKYNAKIMPQVDPIPWLQIWGISSMCGSLFAFKSVNFLQASFKAQFNLFSHVNLNMYNNKYLYTIGLPKSSNYHQSLFLNRFLRFYQKKFFWQIYPIVMKLIVFVYKKIA